MTTRRTSKLRTSLLLAELSLLAAPYVLAQSATGELSITITDGSGAAVSGADVTVTGTDTGAVVRTLKTNEKGIAEVPLPDRYNTHVEAPGFKSFDRNGVTVSVDHVVSLDLPLQLGETTETRFTS